MHEVSTIGNTLTALKTSITPLGASKTAAASSKAATTTKPATNTATKGPTKTTFFGSYAPQECHRCTRGTGGGSCLGQNSRGHYFCENSLCPVAQRKFREKNRKRTSIFETEYLRPGRAKGKKGGLFDIPLNTVLPAVPADAPVRSPDNDEAEGAASSQ